MAYINVNPALIQCITEQFAEEKFTNADVEEWKDEAIQWMKEEVRFGRANTFVQEMYNSYYEWHERLTIGQVRGLVNCIRSEVLSADKQAAATINRIQNGVEELDLRSVPSGNYAVQHGTDETAFYLIDNIRNQDSKWFDWVFIKIRAGDSFIKVGSQRPGQSYQGRHENLLREIAKDPYAAATLFGRLIGRCAICGKTLTDPESISLGIGPVCAEKTGWSSFKSKALKAMGL